ncbi:hypothetical protein Tsp_10093 [Trichinella spiralis]|nr:hypothetical protein Tsp_10093 [Trichinella spiralis]
MIKFEGIVIFCAYSALWTINIFFCYHEGMIMSKIG